MDPGRNITITGNDFSGGELKDNENNFIPFTGENNYAIPLELSTIDANPEGSYPDLDTNDNTKVNKVPRIAVDTKGRVTGVTNHDLILSQSTLTLSGKIELSYLMILILSDMPMVCVWSIAQLLVLLVRHLNRYCLKYWWKHVPSSNKISW